MGDQRLSKIEEPLRAARACRDIVCRAFRERKSTGLRASLVGAYLDTVTEHHRAIDLLIGNGLYGSAFALARPLYDTALRGLWVTMCATDDQVERLCRSDEHDRVMPRGNELRALLDAAYKTGSFFQDGRAEWQALGSYTHSGLLQLGRRGLMGVRQDGYSAWSMVQVIDLCTVWLVLLAKMFFRLAGGNEWALVVQFLHNLYVDKESTPMLYALAQGATRNG